MPNKIHQQLEQLAKEIAAMANFQGGMILLGVEDDGTVSGIQREQLEEWVMNALQNKIHPQKHLAYLGY